MGNKRIQDLPSKGTTIAANDILELSEYQSPGVYISKKILGSELGGVTTFTALTDTPASYTGQTLKFVRVNAGETALEFATVSVSDTNIANTELTLPTGTRKLIWGGANSTDILAFRNSTDTANLFSVSGNGDVFIGDSATGVTVVGYPAISIGARSKTAQLGVSIGNDVGKNQGNGDLRNIYIGNQVASIGVNQTHSYNVGIGSNTLAKITSGASNVVIGSLTAVDLTSASNSVIIGAECGYSLTSGSANTYIGYLSGYYNQSGIGNVQLGYIVNQANVGSKSYNVGLGVRLRTSHDGTIMLGSSADINTPADSISNDSAQFHFRSASQSLFFNKNTNLVLNSQVNLVAGTHFEVAATNTQTVHNGTAPITNITNAYQQYSADVVAGNAAPHFRTEAGDVIKLYKQASAGITTVGDLVTVLTNLGLLG